MEPDTALRIGQESLLLTLVLSAPAVLAAVTVGLLISVLQAATQIQEQTLTFVPKLVAVFGTLAIAGMWMIAQLMRFTISLFENIPRLIQ